MTCEPPARNNAHHKRVGVTSVFHIALVFQKNRFPPKALFPEKGCLPEHYSIEPDTVPLWQDNPTKIIGETSMGFGALNKEMKKRRKEALIKSGYFLKEDFRKGNC